MPAAPPSTLCALLPALDPDLAAGVIGDLLAAIPCRPGHDDPAMHAPGLVRRLAAMHPRDLEEAMLAMQFLAAHCGATRCAEAAAGLDPAGKDASRLRRDAAVQQRVMASLRRALERSRMRPMLADPATGEVRPTVAPAAAGCRRSAAPEQAEEAAEAAEADKPWPPDDVFAGIRI